MRLPSTLPTKFQSPAVESIVSNILSIVGRRRQGLRYRLEEMEAALADHPVVNAACEIRIALTLAAMAPYHHDNEEIQAEVDRSISNYPGQWQDDVSSLMGYLPYGFSYTEVRHKVTASGGAIFNGLRSLSQSRTEFLGRAGELEMVEWKGTTTSGSIERIPYQRGIHLVNQPYLLLDKHPKGLAIMERVMPYYEAYNLLIAALIVAGQRQATPILVGKTDTSAQTYLLDSSGQPILNSATGQPVLIYQGQQMRDQLMELENGSVAVIDRLDAVEAIAQQASADLLMQALDWFTSMMLLSFLVPRTIVVQGNDGVGDAGLAEYHLQTFAEVIKRDVIKVGQAIVEKVFKPEIIWNHGEQENYGSFPIVESQIKNAAQMLKAVSDTIALGQLSTTDPAVETRLKQLAGIA